MEKMQLNLIEALWAQPVTLPAFNVASRGIGKREWSCSVALAK
jgi:hypothetical protein